MTNVLSQDNVLKKEFLVTKDSRNGTVLSVIFPAGIQIGAGTRGFNKGIKFKSIDKQPSDTTNLLYQQRDELYFNGVKLVSGTQSSGGAPTDAQYLTLSSNSSLTAERVLTTSSGISLFDSGSTCILITRPYGANKEIQFNLSGALTASSNLTFDIAQSRLTTSHITSQTVTGSLTKLNSGDSYIVAGDNITILSQSNGSILISSITGSSTGSSAPTDAQYVTLSSNASLTAERVLTQGTGIQIVDGGSTVTISTTTPTSSTLDYSITDIIYYGNTNPGANQLVHDVADTNYTLGHTFSITRSGRQILGVRFAAAVTGTYIHSASIWNNAGTLLASKTATCTTGSFIYSAIFDSPINITGSLVDQTLTVGLYQQAAVSYSYVVNTSLRNTLPTSAVYNRGFVWRTFNLFSAGNAKPTSTSANERYPIEPILSYD